MSGVRRFLSRREKSPHPHHLLHKEHKQDSSKERRPLLRRRALTNSTFSDPRCDSVFNENSTLTFGLQPASPPPHFRGIFTASAGKPDKEEEKKVASVLERLRYYGIENITESNVEYALRARSSNGDADLAFRMLMLLQDTYEGIVKPFEPTVKLLGAVNRDAVTCYLDALLFAMFVRLDSFEAMLYDNFEDPKRKRLAGLIRLWVNLLRSGRLITTDVTEQIQRALADCGWADAAHLHQQDASEAFTFITGQLELPMLTLKMDMFHTGKEDPQDDHKFVNERLLEVAILDAPVDGKDHITLEDCLEHYFNNRIEVKRHLENQRRNTLKSASSDGPTKMEKESATHIEVVEVAETPVGTPTMSTPISEIPTQSKPTAVDLLRPSLRKRADSIFSQRKLELVGIDPEQLKSGESSTESGTMLRKLSTRTEVLMPAWQFFKLLPWYTDNMPTTDAQVAAHFSKKRPVLGICLKRYSYTNAGLAQRRDTYVDIPLEIAVPNFVSDDHLHEDGPLVGNFRLLLQSVVCHRGVSLNSGHYICLSRGRLPSTPSDSDSTEHRGSDASEDVEDPWMRFDDLAKERVTPVDIHEALRREMPYLLFYQVQPIGDDGHSIHDLPTYAEATSRSQSDATPLEKVVEPLPPENALDQVKSEPLPHDRPSLETSVADFVEGNRRSSLDTSAANNDVPRGRTAPDPEPRRTSIAIDTSSISGSTTDSIRTRSIPTTPSDEKSKATLLSVVTKVQSRSGAGSKAAQSRENSRSRPHSRDDSKRFTLNMAKLTQMVTNKSDTGATAAAPPPPLPAAQVSDPARSNSLTGQIDAEKLAVPSAPYSKNPSHESVNTTPKSSRLRKDKAGGKRHRGEKSHEDRDCVVM